MADLNRASLIGRLGKDPEIRSMQNGDKVASFPVATGEKWKDKNSGEEKERTEWHQVVVFGPLVRVIEQYLEKGSTRIALDISRDLCQTELGGSLAVVGVQIGPQAFGERSAGLGRFQKAFTAAERI